MGHRNLEYERYMSLSPASKDNIPSDDLIAIFDRILYVNHLIEIAESNEERKD